MVSVDIIYTTRIINSKLLSIIINLDGSIEDLLKKVEIVSSLSDEQYKEFSELSNERKED